MSEDVLGVRYSPDQRLLAVALLDCTVKIFFADTLKVRKGGGGGEREGEGERGRVPSSHSSNCVGTQEHDQIWYTVFLCSFFFPYMVISYQCFHWIFPL